MASVKCHVRLSVMILMIFLSMESKAKLSDNKTNDNNSNSSSEVRPSPKKQPNGDSPALLFADEFKQTLEKYLFGICPHNFKMQLGGKAKNLSSYACDLDPEQNDLAGRLATLALRAHSAWRNDCGRLGAALANTFGELARTAANRQVLNAAAATAATEAKKRKLSKSQKMKIVAKQRKALAVKNKAAAVAAAAAAKVAANSNMS